MKTLIAATALALTAFSASAMVDTSGISQFAPNCQRQSKSEPKGSAKCCHFGFGIISVKTSASIRAAALVI